VITILTGVRIMLATRPVDFRRGAHSLAALAAIPAPWSRRESLPSPPPSNPAAACGR